jgi:hypothetical protein
MSSGNASLLDATRAWLAEKPNYRGENIPQGNFGSYGHYTQVRMFRPTQVRLGGGLTNQIFRNKCIWPTTTKVGIAAAKTSNGATYIVARYTPPGNWYGLNAYGTNPSNAKAIDMASIGKTPAEPSSERTVVDGDSISDITEKFGVSLDGLKSCNPQIEGPGSVVRKGDVLTVPYTIPDKSFSVEVL